MEERLSDLLMRLHEKAENDDRFSSRDMEKIVKLAVLFDEFEISNTEELVTVLYYG